MDQACGLLKRPLPQAPTDSGKVMPEHWLRAGESVLKEHTGHSVIFIDTGRMLLLQTWTREEVQG